MFELFTITQRIAKARKEVLFDPEAPHRMRRIFGDFEAVVRGWAETMTPALPALQGRKRCKGEAAPPDPRATVTAAIEAAFVRGLAMGYEVREYLAKTKDDAEGLFRTRKPWDLCPPMNPRYHMRPPG